MPSNASANPRQSGSARRCEGATNATITTSEPGREEGRMKIDWGTLQPSYDLRDAVETSIEPSSDLGGETLALCRSDSEYEALIAPRLPERPTALRLRGDDLVDIASRAARL